MKRNDPRTGLPIIGGGQLVNAYSVEDAPIPVLVNAAASHFGPLHAAVLNLAVCDDALKAAHSRLVELLMADGVVVIKRLPQPNGNDDGGRDGTQQGE